MLIWFEWTFINIYINCFSMNISISWQTEGSIITRITLRKISLRKGDKAAHKNNKNVTEKENYLHTKKKNKDPLIKVLKKRKIMILFIILSCSFIKIQLEIIVFLEV